MDATARVEDRLLETFERVEPNAEHLFERLAIQLLSVWFDGIYCGLRSEDVKLCVLVLIDINEQGRRSCKCRLLFPQKCRLKIPTFKAAGDQPGL